NVEKRERVAAALKVDPERSNPAIAEACGVSHTFVAKVRRKLSAQRGCNVATPSADRKSRTGKKGEGQHRKPSQAPTNGEESGSLSTDTSAPSGSSATAVDNSNSEIVAAAPAAIQVSAPSEAEFRSEFGLNWQPAVVNGSANRSDPVRLVEALKATLHTLTSLGLCRNIWSAIEQAGREHDPELRHLIQAARIQL